MLTQGSGKRRVRLRGEQMLVTTPRVADIGHPQRSGHNHLAALDCRHVLRHPDASAAPQPHSLTSHRPRDGRHTGIHLGEWGLSICARHRTPDCENPLGGGAITPTDERVRYQVSLIGEGRSQPHLLASAICLFDKSR